MPIKCSLLISVMQYVNMFYFLWISYILRGEKKEIVQDMFEVIWKIPAAFQMKTKKAKLVLNIILQSLTGVCLTI